MYVHVNAQMTWLHQPGYIRTYIRTYVHAKLYYVHMHMYVRMVLFVLGIFRGPQH